MMNGIDISNWKRGFSLEDTRPEFVMVKATEGIGFVDKSCDGFVQEAIRLDIPFGFYHFARRNDSRAEARFFHEQTRGYDRKGIPVLDLEANQSAEFVRNFMDEYHDLTGVWPWLYTSAYNLRNVYSDFVAENCGLWVAGYPRRMTDFPDDPGCPYNVSGWELAAWQFTDCLDMGGMSVDADVFYGDREAWHRYADPGYGESGVAPGDDASRELDDNDWHVARQVIDGEYGNGDERRDRLGDRYDGVQDCVNQLLTSDDENLAEAVINGEMGDGEERKYILAGRYLSVQRLVNRMLR
jgi:GH25 family lysozyme M1 (1,4-beta-N-acetylmuramidase)